jgi:hypothetical protein
MSVVFFLFGQYYFWALFVNFSGLAAYNRDLLRKEMIDESLCQAIWITFFKKPLEKRMDPLRIVGVK